MDDPSGAGTAPTARESVRTYWEEVNLTDWSRYLTTVEKKGGIARDRSCRAQRHFPGDRV